MTMTKISVTIQAIVMIAVATTLCIQGATPLQSHDCLYPIPIFMLPDDVLAGSVRYTSITRTSYFRDSKLLQGCKELTVLRKSMVFATRVLKTTQTICLRMGNVSVGKIMGIRWPVFVQEGQVLLTPLGVG